MHKTKTRGCVKLLRPFQVGPVNKLKINGFLYGIIILSITGGHFL